MILNLKFDDLLNYLVFLNKKSASVKLPHNRSFQDGLKLKLSMIILMMIQFLVK